MLNARSNGIDVSIVNPTAVIGPNDFAPSLSGKMMMDVYTGKLRSLVKGGFDWVDVRDIANAIVNIIEKDIQNEKFILSGHWMEFKDLGNLICSEKGSDYRGFISPIYLAKIGLPFISIWAKFSGTDPLYNYESLKAIEEGSKINDHGNAKRLLNYNPRPLKETIYDSIEWFKQNKYI
jgi:dihydroflavonol-4-reductase